jgi:tetratricopeptide (TPR) repeat protein
MFDELLSHPASRRLLLVLNSHRLHNWFLAELVLGRAFELGFDDPAEALAFAELGVALADQLPTEKYGASLVADMRARAWGVLANSRRINSDLDGAHEAFETALEHLDNGTGDPVEDASISTKRGRYFMVRRDFKRSLRVYDRAIGIYRRLGEVHLMGKAMIDKAIVYSSAGDIEASIEWNQKGLASIAPELDPRASLAAKHNLSLLLHRRGDVDQAMSLLQEILPLYAQQNDAMVLLRLRWLEGRLAQAQRQFRRAEEAFREVQKGFLDREIPFEAAIVSFDLATVLLDEGRFAELKELAVQILSVFRGFGIAREVIAALELFQKAIEAQKLSVAWIGELATYVEESRSNPGRPFEPSR